MASTKNNVIGKFFNKGILQKRLKKKHRAMDLKWSQWPGLSGKCSVFSAKNIDDFPNRINNFLTTWMNFFITLLLLRY
jgi:hypothetical protein